MRGVSVWSHKTSVMLGMCKYKPHTLKKKHEKEVNALKMDPVFMRPLSPAAFTVCSSDSSSLKLL